MQSLHSKKRKKESVVRKFLSPVCQDAKPNENGRVRCDVESCVVQNFFRVRKVNLPRMAISDLEITSRLFAIENRLSVIEQMLLRLYALMQEHVRLRNG